MARMSLIPKVFNSSNVESYERWLSLGRSNRDCTRLAFELFGESISRESFRRYRQVLYEVRRTEQEFPYRHSKPEIDEETILMQTILIQEKRVVKGLKVEDRIPIPLARVDRMMRDLTYMVIKLVEIRERKFELELIHGKLKQTSMADEKFR